MIVERRRRRRWLWLVGIAIAVSLAVLSAMALDEPGPCATPKAAPRSEIELMPAGLSFDEIGTVTQVRTDQRYVTVQAFTTKPLDEVAVLIQDAVVAAGYRPAGMDNEGVEAEVFFTKGLSAAGQARVEPSGCEGRSNIELVLLDR